MACPAAGQSAVPRNFGRGATVTVAVRGLARVLHDAQSVEGSRYFPRAQGEPDSPQIWS